MRLQQVQQTLQTILQQKQQVDMESSEIDQTLKELEKTADDAVIYKAAGSLLIKAEKTKVSADLTERKDLLSTRQTVLSRQEERLRTQLKDLQTQLQSDLQPSSSPPPAWKRGDVKLVELGIPELTNEQIEAVSEAAEDAARKHIFSKVKQKQVETLNISVDAEGAKPVNVTVEVDLALLPQAKGVDEKALAKEAVQAAFEAIEKYLRKLTWPSKK
jgi:prefoldin beta subunit